ncbi:hypothetical protein [Hydrogenophaga luteola]|uniref:Uncharacterized protein n=1 Tax=Hydrogenophaga luteola TaxID=1591122 RepID=A0ABV7W7M6_9BURK
MQQPNAAPSSTATNASNGLQPGVYTKSRIKEHLIGGKYSAEALFQLYVVQTRAHLFEGRPHGAAEEMQFRSALATSVGLTINEVFIVGSAQTGFSTKPTAKLRDFDGEFKKTSKRRDKSDVDVAIVSARYFDQLHREIYKFTAGFKNSWTTNVYYADDESMQHFDLPRVDANFYQYLARGWFRRDLVPDEFNFAFKNVVDDWKNRLDRKISVAIYREWSLLRDYQIESFKLLKDDALKGYL